MGWTVGRLSGFSLTRNGEQNITVTVSGDMSEAYDELKDGAVEFEIRKARKHRSIEANRYCWMLVDQIAAKTRIRKSEVYRNAIREIGGVSRDLMMKAEAVPLFRTEWEAAGLGNQVELVDVEPETGYASLRVYFGSSTYDTRQMGALLDSLIQDAEALGIPTISAAEEEKMLRRWGRKMEVRKNERRDDSGAGHPENGGGVSEDERGQLPEDQPEQGTPVCPGDEGREMAAERREHRF